MLLLILPQLFLDSSPKNILSSFINPQVVSNLYEFLLLSNSMKNTVESVGTRNGLVTNIIQMMTKFSFLGELSF